MANDFSIQELNGFLDYLRTKGLMKADSVAARKAAVNNILGILTADEAKDVRQLDLNDVAVRFANLKGSGFKPDSIRVYKSRVSASLADFIAYRKNPMTFKPSVSGQRNAAFPKGDKNEKPGTAKPKAETPNSFQPSSDEVTFPIPIRPNIMVKLVGIPGEIGRASCRERVEIWVGA